MTCCAVIGSSSGADMCSSSPERHGTVALRLSLRLPCSLLLASPLCTDSQEEYEGVIGALGTQDRTRLARPTRAIKAIRDLLSPGDDCRGVR